MEQTKRVPTPASRGPAHWANHQLSFRTLTGLHRKEINIVRSFQELVLDVLDFRLFLVFHHGINCFFLAYFWLTCRSSGHNFSFIETWPAPCCGLRVRSLLPGPLCPGAAPASPKTAKTKTHRFQVQLLTFPFSAHFFREISSGKKKKNTSSYDKIMRFSPQILPH